MWIAEALFEGSGDSFQKLLRPGKQYRVGRKLPANLILAERTVSQDAGYVEIKDWKPSDRSLNDARALPPWPKAILHAGSKNVRVISRHDEAQWRHEPDSFDGESVQAGQQRPLESGDILLFSRRAPSLRIVWQPLSLWIAPNLVFDQQMKERQLYLGHLGIAIVSQKTLVKDSTHFVVNNTSPTALLLEALVNGLHIVCDAFVEAIDTMDPESLESRLSLPSVENYFPNDRSMDDATFQELKSKSMPDDRRLTLLEGLTLLFCSQSADFNAQVSQEEHVYTLAGAHVEHCDASTLAKLADAEKTRRFLRDAQREASLRTESSRDADLQSAIQKGLVIITSKDDYDQPWHSSLAKASRELQIPMPEEGLSALRNAMLFVAPLRFLDHLAPEQETEEEGSPEQDEVHSPQEEREAGRPPSIRDVQSPQDEVMESLNQQPSATPAQPANDEAAHSSLTTERASGAKQFAVPATPSVRKPRRRAGIEQADPFADVFGSLISAAPSSAALPPTQAQDPSQQQSEMSQASTSEFGPTPQSLLASPSRLRRNVPGNRQQARRSDVWSSVFDEGGMYGAKETESSASGVSDARTQNTQERYSKRFRRELDEMDKQATQKEQASVEAENRTDQEDGDVTARPDAGRKRRAEEEAHDERDDDAAETDQVYGDEATHQQSGGEGEGAASAREQSFIPEQPANITQTSAKDEKFLQSLASLKKNKKRVDVLDKEFDQLRIARPKDSSMASTKAGFDTAAGHTIIVEDDLLNDPEYRHWQGMSIEDFQVNAVGNFVQVDFVPLVREQKQIGDADVSDEIVTTHTSWRGRPNYKKFRAKEGQHQHRRPVQLDLEQPKDFGIQARLDVPTNKRSQPTQTQSRAAKMQRSGVSQKRSIFKPRQDEDDESESKGKEDVGEELGELDVQSVRPSLRASNRTLPSQQASRQLSNRGQRKPEIDLHLDVDDEEMDELDDRLLLGDSFDDGFVSTNSRTARSDSNGRKKDTRSQSKAETITLSESEPDDSDGNSGGFSFKGFKGARGSTQRARQPSKRSGRI